MKQASTDIVNTNFKGITVP